MDIDRLSVDPMSTGDALYIRSYGDPIEPAHGRPTGDHSAPTDLAGGYDISLDSQNYSKIAEQDTRKRLSDLQATLSDDVLSALMKQYILSSDQPSAVSGTTRKPVPAFLVQVEQLASSLEIMSDPLIPRQPTRLAPMHYTFSISRGADTHRFEIDVEPGDDNQSVLAAVTDAINASDSPVKADFMLNRQTQDVRLALFDPEASADGYLIEDVEGAFFTALGMTNATEATPEQGGIVQPAQSAKIKLDDREYESQTNVFDIPERGMQIIVKAPTDRPAQLETQTDATAIESQLGQIFENYNGALEHLMALGTSESEKLFDRVARTTVTSDAFLRLMGIDRNPMGFIKYNPVEMRKAISENAEKVEPLFTGTEGFLTKLTRELKQIVEEIQRAKVSRQNAAEDLNSDPPTLYENMYNFVGKLMLKNHLIFSSVG